MIEHDQDKALEDARAAVVAAARALAANTWPGEESYGDPSAPRWDEYIRSLLDAVDDLEFLEQDRGS